MQHSRKERCATSLTVENSLLQSRFGLKSEVYYFTELFKYLAQDNMLLGNESPSSLNSEISSTYIDHFGLMVKSYQLVRTLQKPLDSFLVQKMVYLPPNLQSSVRSDQ